MDSGSCSLKAFSKYMFPTMDSPVRLFGCCHLSLRRYRFIILIVIDADLTFLSVGAGLVPLVYFPLEFRRSDPPVYVV